MTDTLLLDPKPKVMNLQDIKRKTPQELLALAEELQIENASTLRKQEGRATMYE